MSIRKPSSASYDISPLPEILSGIRLQNVQDIGQIYFGALNIHEKALPAFLQDAGTCVASPLLNMVFTNE
jgi:hypothetical protein